MPEVGSGPVKIPHVPDLHDPVFEKPEVLPVTIGGLYPELQEYNTGERDCPEPHEIIFVFICNVMDPADMRAGPPYPDRYHHMGRIS